MIQNQINLNGVTVFSHHTRRPYEYTLSTGKAMMGWRKIGEPRKPCIHIAHRPPMES